MALRPSLCIDGHDPASIAGQIAFMELDNPERARYLKAIEYLERDVSSLLALLTDEDRLTCLAYRDDFASQLAWP